jgi:hypothetical protein
MPLKFVPQWILRRFFPSWPESQLRVLRRFLQSTAAIYASLTMADDAMKTVLELDVGFLREFSDKLWFYYAESDLWVSEQREAVLRALSGTPAEVRVVYGHSDIPHDFSISEQSCLDFPQVEVLTLFVGQTIAPRWPHNV